MKTAVSCLTVAAILFATNAYGFGAEDAVAPDPDDKPIALRIWYPNTADNPNLVHGQNLPLVIISHGTGGSNRGHEDTARALADAGFIVAAIMHTGDNYKDNSYVGQGKQLLGRPRHVSRAIDYMLLSWRAHNKIDPGRIGMFGMSAGGFTALVVAGGQPDLARTDAYCRENPLAWTCEYLQKNGVSVRSMKSPSPAHWVHDDRVKAAVLAVPAIGYSFQPNGLANVRIPIQLWAAGRDEIVKNSPDIIRKLLPVNIEYHLVPGAGHFSFLTPCNWTFRATIAVMSWFGTEKICNDPKGFDRQSFHKDFDASVVRFLSTNLKTQRPLIP